MHHGAGTEKPVRRRGSVLDEVVGESHFDVIIYF